MVVPAAKYHHLQAGATGTAPLTPLSCDDNPASLEPDLPATAYRPVLIVAENVWRAYRKARKGAHHFPEAEPPFVADQVP